MVACGKIHHLFILDERLMMGSFEAIQRNKTLIHTQMWVTLHVVSLVLPDMSPDIKDDRICFHSYAVARTVKPRSKTADWVD